MLSDAACIAPLAFSRIPPGLDDVKPKPCCCAGCRPSAMSQPIPMVASATGSGFCFAVPPRFCTNSLAPLWRR